MARRKKLTRAALKGRGVRSYQFFKGAGGRVGHTAAIALSLAKAEEEARRRGWDYEYWPEQERYEDVYGEPDPGGEWVTVVLKDAKGNVLASLGFVDERDSDYLRIVRAELADEALSGKRKRVRILKNPRITKRDLNVTKLRNGGIEVAAVVNNQRVARQYHGYTKREAISLFLREVKQLGGRMPPRSTFTNPRRKKVMTHRQALTAAQALVRHERAGLAKGNPVPGGGEVSESMMLVDIIHFADAIIGQAEGKAQVYAERIRIIARVLLEQVSRGIHKNPATRDLGGWASYHALATYLGKRDSRTLAHNTFVTRMGPEGPIDVVFHYTHILSFDLDGNVTVNTNGYHTVTTKQRLNQFLVPHGYRISSVRYHWFVYNLRTGEKQPYEDGMKLSLGSTVTPGNLAYRGPMRENPVLAVMGANPPTGADIRATWANLVYSRPDDPEGPRTIRKHEFPDGFVATPLKDGRVVLSHPNGKSLWTRR